MATIEDNINRKRIEAEDQIRKSLAPTWEHIKNEIIKGKRAQVGEVRTWGGIKMRKEANGWVPVKEGGAKPKAEGEKGDNQPVSLEEHAKNASEQALVNATKMSQDPKIREAAHKELMRRKNEEAQETFKAPEKLTKEEQEIKDFDDEHAPGGPVEKENIEREKRLKERLEKETKPAEKEGVKHEKILPKAKDDSEKESKGKKEYSIIRDWIGDEHKDEHIDSVIEQLQDAGIEDRDLKVNGSSMESFNGNVDKKVKQLMGDIREGLLHKDMKLNDAKDILWGMVMSNKDGNKFFGK